MDNETQNQAKMKAGIARLVTAGGEIRSAPMPDATDIAYMARQLVQATLPHADPGDVPAWSRTNGNVGLTIRPGWDRRKSRSVGYPYGTIPRLLMFWLTTEAIRTKSRRVELGNSLAGFMRALGLDPQRGGPRSDARRLRDQMDRLFQASITFDRTDGPEWMTMPVAAGAVLWWDPRDPGQDSMFGSWVLLNQEFFDAITAAPVPCDLRALRALKRSPLALDLYAFLTYRTYQATRTGKPVFVTWAQLMEQLGTDYAHVQHFRAKTKDTLRKIAAVYPGLRLGKRRGGIEVLPGAAAVPPRASTRLLPVS